MPGNFYPRHYPVTPLGNINKIAKSTGTNAGYNEFMEGLINHQRDLAKERLEARIKAQQEAASERAEKAAAAQEESSDPESPSWWDKLDQFGLDIVDKQEKALSWTMDKLSRPLYGVTNAFQEMGHQAYQGEKDDFGKVAGEFWKGVTGDKKQDMIQMIAHEAKANKKDDVWDNRWAQVGGGLLADIVMDPLTFAGAGIVTRPINAAKQVKQTSKLDNLAGDIEKLGVTRTKTARELSREKEGVLGPHTKEEYEARVPLTNSEIKALLGVRGFQASGRKAQQAENVRAVTENLPRLRKMIKEDPNLPTDETLLKLDDEIKRLKLDRNAQLDDFAKESMKRAAAEFDSNPKYWAHIKAPERRSLLKEVERSTVLAKTAHAFHSEGFLRRGSSSNKSFDEVLGRGWKEDARISDEFRSTAYDTVERLAKQDKAHRTYTRSNIKIRDYIKQQEENLKAASKGSDEYKAISDNIRRAKDKRNYNNRRQSYIKAHIFHNMLNHHVNSLEGASKGLMDELSELEFERAELLREAESLVPENRLAVGSEDASHALPEANEGTQVRSSADTEDGSIVFDRSREIKDRLREIDNRTKEIENSDEFLSKSIIEAPEGAPSHITEDFLNSKIDDPELDKWRDSVAREVDMRAEDIFEKKVATFVSSAKEQAIKKEIPEYETLRKMFGNPKAKKSSAFGETIGDDLLTPMIKVKGKPIYQTDKEAIDKAGLITDADRVEAIRRSAPKEGSETYKEAKTIVENLKDIKTKLDEGDLDIIEGRRLELERDNLKERLNILTSGSKTTTSPAHVAFERVFQEQHGKKLSSAVRWKNTKIKDIRAKAKSLRGKTPRIPKSSLRAEARTEAMGEVTTEIGSSGLRASTSKDFQFELWEDSAGLDDMYKASVDQAREEFIEASAKLRDDGVVGKELTEQIAELRKLKDTKIALHKEALEEAKKTREAMADRLDEQLILDALNDATLDLSQKRLQITFAGKSVVGPGIPSPKMLTAATEKLGGLPILQRANHAWSEAFKPASKIEPELNLARLRAQANTPLIIKHHVDDIRHRFAKYKPSDRKAALKGLKRGVPVGDRAMFDEMNAYLEELKPYLTGQVKVAGKPLELMEINRYLDERYRFVGKDSKYTGHLNLDTPQNILQAMRRLPDDADPMQVMWNVRIATEQALAEKNMRNVISSLYGVKREILVGKEAKKLGLSEQGKMVESLRENHGWTTINDLGEEHLFAPETAGEIRKLLDMLKPENTKLIMRGYDKIIRAWKTAVTVYNPGYYTRNGIGEYMMGMFDGLTDPRWYSKSAHILRFAKPDHMEDVLKSLEPWKKHQTLAQKGSRKVVKMKKTEDLSAEDVWVLYHDTGLKSGFISSEFDHYFPAMGSAKATLPGRAATGINDGVRNAGEKYEDFFRLSHFMYRLAKSEHKDIMKAAEEAATIVRKYHFDYTDFTPFEKTTMLRLFPFYKWTRKSIPLMASMLFTQPGKMMLYPKAMQAASYGTGGTDILSDDNGFAPNYEELTPKWMRGLMAYPMGRDQDDAMTYMNIATPQMDSLKMLADPVGTGTGMFTPGLKVLIEQVQGHPMDAEFSDMDIEGAKGRAEHLARTTPFGALMRNIITNNEPDQDSAVNEHGNVDEKLLSFLTGLGFYENNKSRQQGEQLRQNLGGRP